MSFALLVDLDDTLVPNAFTYFQPQLDMAGLIAWDLGYHSPNPVIIINRATEIQVKQIVECGYISKHNFPMSYVDTYVELCNQRGRTPNDKVKGAIFMSGVKYFKQKYDVYPGVVETLKDLRENYGTSLTTIIVTRGDESIQQYKIDNTGLGQYFDHVEICSAKNKQTYLDIIEKYKLDPKRTVMVGDSLRNDIVPAMEAGLHTIRVAAEDATDWEKSSGIIETGPDFHGHFRTVKAFWEVNNYLDKILELNPVEHQ
jgi:putative hydrolase of the HAD superfamily